MTIKTDDKRYAFRVYFSLEFDVSITRYELVKVNEKTVVYRGITKEVREAKYSDRHHWFPTHAKARDFAERKIRANTLKLQTRIEKLATCLGTIMSNRVQVVQPMKPFRGKIRL